jgi:hypothetical protein
MEVFQYFEELFSGNTKVEPPMEVKGTFRFHLEPTIKGQAPLHTISIVIACYDDKEKWNKIDFSIKWCKIMNKDVYEIKDYSEPYYHVNPSDIDLRIRAVVTSKNQKYPGTAILNVGPIMLDGALKPEIEGMVLNKSASFKCTFISLDQEKMSPNISVLLVEKPFLRVTFDPKMVSRESEAKKAQFKDLEFDFETDTNMKVKIDSFNINNATIQYKVGDTPHVLLAKFDNRMQRDLFYIYQKLMRMLRSKILEDMDTGYTRLLSMPWNFLNGGVDFDSYDELRGFQFIYSSDLVRETLKTMVRLNKMLQEENVTLVDSIDILEQDLQLSINQFRELLEDGKAKNTKNLRKFERSHRSIIQESSVILDGIRVKNKRQKKQNDDSIIESTRELQDELASIKKTNEILKKEIETFKGAPKNPSTGTGSSTAPKMDSLLLSVIQVS